MPHPKPDLEKNGSVFLFLYARRHPAHPVSVLILHPTRGKIQALWSQNYDTETLHRNVVKGVGSAMSCYRPGYDRRNICTPASQVIVVVFTSNRSLYPKTLAVPPLSVLVLHHREIQIMWSQTVRKINLLRYPLSTLPYPSRKQKKSRIIQSRHFEC